MAGSERAATLYSRNSAFTSKLMGQYSAFSPYRLMRRELGLPVPVGAGDAMARSLYCGMKPIAFWDPLQMNALPTGGVFNLEFSPEGSILVAACERKSIQIFDPATHKRVQYVNGAHSDCVNCVKFLDNRMFATCSDDTTIALWDVRNLRKKIRTLTGHSNWVKNIEFSVKDQLLVTSGLDGSIYTWDINSDMESATSFKRVFHASGLMRCRLSPDASQMVMCTTGGLLVIIHDLNLATLANDLHGFKPNLYRLMQMSLQLIPIAATYDHLFDKKRKENRVEFVSDFPEGNDAEVVSALQIHPQGWTALSRNLSHDDKSEWTCVHDIQPRRASDPVGRQRRPRRARLRLALQRLRNRPQTSAAAAGESTTPAPTESPPSGSVPTQPGVPCIQNDVWEASITVGQRRLFMAMASRGQAGRNFNMQRIMGINTGISPPDPPQRRTRAGGDTRHARNRVLPSLSGQTSRPEELEAEPRYFIRQNADRLLYYAEETNEGKGFIKELCYSADGRLICSPFGRGMRLLAVNEYCGEISHCVGEDDPPRPLVELGQSLGHHHDLVVSTKFSPRYRQLVTGCLEGKIVWYEPFSGEQC